MEDGPQAQLVQVQYVTVSANIVNYTSWDIALCFYFNKSAVRIKVSLLAWYGSVEMFNHTNTTTMFLVQTTNETSFVPHKAHLLAQIDFRGANYII